LQLFESSVEIGVRVAFVQVVEQAVSSLRLSGFAQAQDFTQLRVEAIGRGGGTRLLNLASSALMA
jgi:hypothetical protein